MSCLNFSDLRDLHKCANDLLHSPQFQQALLHQQNDVNNNGIMSSVQEVSEASLKMLDLCSATRDVFHLVKQHLLELQQSFRRAKIEDCNGRNFKTRVSDHRSYRKKLKKDVVKCLRDIKGLMKTNKCFTSDLSRIDHSLIVIVHVLREVRGATLSTLESLLSLITLSITAIAIVQGQKERPFASKLMRMKCQSVLLERCDSMEIRMEKKKLEEVISVVGKLEVELESILRRLMQTRVLLLNVLTN